MADAPLACSGDSTRDGVESSRAVATIAEKLRTLADWLDAHPDAVVHQINFIDVKATGLARVDSFGCKSVEEMYDRALALDSGSWKFEATETAFSLTREVTPGVEFHFFLSKARLEPMDHAA